MSAEFLTETNQIGSLETLTCALDTIAILQCTQITPRVQSAFHATHHTRNRIAVMISWNWNEIVFAEYWTEKDLAAWDCGGTLVSLSCCDLGLDELVHSSLFPVLRGLVATFLTA